jgi:hypothetical protein
MSEITLFKSGAFLPDYLRGEPDELTKRLAGSAGTKTISTEGGVFRMMVGGEEVAKNEDRGMNIVIINAAQHVARAYYEDTYVKGESNGPSCASGDGKTPDASIESPQSRSCATCPQNIAGSGLNNSRACRFNQRFAVLLENDLSGNVYRLQLPATSLFGKVEGDKMPLQAYAKFLAGHGVPMSGIVTEARFDTSVSVPVLKFRAIRPLTQEELVVARAQGASEDALQAVEFKMAPPKETPALPIAFAKAPAKSAPPQDAPQGAPEDAREERPVTEPVKRASKKAEPAAAPKDVAAVLDAWGSDDE